MSENRESQHSHEGVDASENRAISLFADERREDILSIVLAFAFVVLAIIIFAVF